MKYVICLLLLPFTAFADGWESDSNGRFDFEASFEGEPLPGQFSGFRVSYLERRSLTVTVSLAASDMGDEEMNAILHDSSWFAVTRFGEARYSSTDVKCDESGACTSIGELQLKGVTREISVPFTWDAEDGAATMQGELTLDRTAFDVGSGEWSSGDSIGIDVKLSFDIRLNRRS